MCLSAGIPCSQGEQYTPLGFLGFFQVATETVVCLHFAVLAFGLNSSRNLSGEGSFFSSQPSVIPQHPISLPVPSPVVSLSTRRALCMREESWAVEGGGLVRICSWEEEPFVTDLRLHTHTPKDFPQDLVAWHNLLDDDTLSEELQDNPFPLPSSFLSSFPSSSPNT